MLSRLWCAFTLGVVGCLSTSTTSAAPEPDIAPLLRPDELRLLKISPDGKRIAIVRKADFVDSIAIYDTVKRAVTPLFHFGGGELLDYWWKSDDRLLVHSSGNDSQSGFMTVDVSTQHVRQMLRLSRSGVWPAHCLPADPDHVLMATQRNTGWELRLADLVHDTLTGVQEPLWQVRDWTLAKDGTPLVGFGEEDGNWFLAARRPGSTTWENIPLGHSREPDLLPLAARDGQVIAFDYRSRDTSTAVFWDPLTRSSRVIAAPEHGDCTGLVYWGDFSPEPRGVSYDVLHPKVRWFSPADQRTMAEIDDALPETMNRVVSCSADENRLVISASSPVAPTRFWLLDRKAAEIKPIGAASALPPGSRTAVNSTFEFTSSDGLQISGVLWDTSREHRAPLIILVAGDLANPATPSFAGDIQVFVNAGYAVALVNRRGKLAFGRAFANAGKKAIATGMSQDIIEATEYLLAQRPAATRKAVMMGSGMGGVVAMHALARRPELFASWVNYGTPMSARWVALDEALIGTDESYDLLRHFGSAYQAESYANSLDPSPLLKTLTLPSFHFYTRSTHDNSIVADGDRVKKALAANGTKFRFATVEPYTDIVIERREGLRRWLRNRVHAFQETITFLHETVPPDR